MKKQILFLLMAGTLVASSNSTRCTTPPQTIALIGCGSTMVAAGLYQICKNDDSLLSKICQGIQGGIITVSGLAVIVSSQHLPQLMNELYTQLQQELLKKSR